VLVAPKKKARRARAFCLTLVAVENGLKGNRSGPCARFSMMFLKKITFAAVRVTLLN